MARLILWADASFYRDDRGPVTAAIAVVDNRGVTHVAEVIELDTNTRAERRAVGAAFQVAKEQGGPVEIRTDCQTAARMQPPQGVRLQHIDRSRNLAHRVARRTAREDLERRGLGELLNGPPSPQNPPKKKRRGKPNPYQMFTEDGRMIRPRDYLPRSELAEADPMTRQAWGR